MNHHIKALNLEQNRIGAEGVVAFAELLREGSSLEELKLDHQEGRGGGGLVLGSEAELDLVRAVEGSALRKMTVALRHIQSKDILHRALMRNFDGRRLTRISSVGGQPRRLTKSETIAQLGAAFVPAT